MAGSELDVLPAELAAELERRFFWWEPVGPQPRSHARILAQAMDLASFDDVRRLEDALGPRRLAEAMLEAEPGWISARSWEFWRGRLTRATGLSMPDEPPRRSFDAGQSLAENNVETSFASVGGARTDQDDLNTLHPPLRTSDATLLVASREDLLTTKLKAILDRAEAKDYRDIAVMVDSHGSSRPSFRRRFARKGARRVRRDVWQGPGPASPGHGILQGRRPAVASRVRSGHIAESEGSRLRDSGCCDNAWFARGIRWLPASGSEINEQS